MNDITILFLPGLTGDSKCEYVRATSLTVQNSGFRVVVFNYRGIGGIELKVIINKITKIVYIFFFSNFLWKFLLELFVVIFFHFTLVEYHLNKKLSRL